MNILKKKQSILFLNFLKYTFTSISLILIYGFLTLDVNANTNSRIGAFLLSFLLPYFIVLNTSQITPIQRILKYGLGIIFYIILCISIPGVKITLLSGTLPCLLIALFFLYSGGYFFSKKNILA